MNNKSLMTLIVVILTSGLLFWYRQVNITPQADLPNTLIIGTSADFPPFAFTDTNHELTGFDIAIAKEVGKRLGMTTDIQDMRFDLLLPELQMGHIHMIAAGLTPTPERAQNVLFTKPYISANPLVVVSLATNPIDSIEELKNKEVIVNTGYSADTYLAQFPDINLTRLNTIAEAFAVLDKGGATAFVTASNTLKPVFEKLDKQRFKTFILPQSDETNALAISKRYDYLLPKIQKALDDMQADGTIDALKQEWKLV